MLRQRRLGLQTLALLARLRGVATHLLGTDTPPEEIVGMAMETGASGVLRSISLAAGGPATDRRLADLRERHLRARTLVACGAGARGPRQGPRGIIYLGGLRALDTWLAGLAPPADVG